jgi:hypothetical protein
MYKKGDNLPHRSDASKVIDVHPAKVRDMTHGLPILSHAIWGYEDQLCVDPLVCNSHVSVIRYIDVQRTRKNLPSVNC